MKWYFWKVSFWILSPHLSIIILQLPLSQIKPWKTNSTSMIESNWESEKDTPCILRSFLRPSWAVIVLPGASHISSSLVKCPGQLEMFDFDTHMPVTPSLLMIPKYVATIICFPFMTNMAQTLEPIIGLNQFTSQTNYIIVPHKLVSQDPWLGNRSQGQKELLRKDKMSTRWLKYHIDYSLHTYFFIISFSVIIIHLFFTHERK